MDMASSSVLQNSLRLNKEGCPPAVHPDTPAFLSRIRASLQFQTATSSIDTRTERIIQESMDRLMHGRTTFVIAHRLSTVRNSDCIMVLEQGRIIERGTHDQLISEKGKYYQLYTGNAIAE